MPTHRVWTDLTTNHSKCRHCSVSLRPRAPLEIGIISFWKKSTNFKKTLNLYEFMSLLVHFYARPQGNPVWPKFTSESLQSKIIEAPAESTKQVSNNSSYRWWTRRAKTCQNQAFCQAGLDEKSQWVSTHSRAEGISVPQQRNLKILVKTINRIENNQQRKAAMWLWASAKKALAIRENHHMCPLIFSLSSSPVQFTIPCTTQDRTTPPW